MASGKATPEQKAMVQKRADGAKKGGGRILQPGVDRTASGKPALGRASHKGKEMWLCTGKGGKCGKSGPKGGQHI